MEFSRHRLLKYTELSFFSLIAAWLQKKKMLMMMNRGATGDVVIDWLQIPKDVWKHIIMYSLDTSLFDIIGWCDFYTIMHLRLTCRFFAALLQPDFCLRIIFSNPRADLYPYYCDKCIYYLGDPLSCDYHFWPRNPYYGQKVEMAKNNFRQFRWKVCDVPEIAKPAAATTKVKKRQPTVAQGLEQQVFNRRGLKLAAKKSFEREKLPLGWIPKKRNTNRTYRDDGRWGRLNTKGNHKKTKWRTLNVDFYDDHHQDYESTPPTRRQQYDLDHDDESIEYVFLDYTHFEREYDSNDDAPLSPRVYELSPPRRRYNDTSSDADDYYYDYACRYADEHGY